MAFIEQGIVRIEDPIDSVDKAVEIFNRHLEGMEPEAIACIEAAISHLNSLINPPASHDQPETIFEARTATE